MESKSAQLATRAASRTGRPLGALARLGRLLKRPLWIEDVRTRAARRLRQGLVTPFMALAGVIWGALAAPVSAEALGWMAGGAVAFSILAYLYFRVQPAILQIAHDRWGRGGWLAGMAWDWLMVGGVVYLLTDVLGMPTFRAVTSAVVIGGSYAMLLASFFDEDGSRFLHGLLGGGWGGRPRVGFSHIETLVSRGEGEAAREALREFVVAHPDDARGWITLGRLTGEPDRAVEIFRRGLERARLTVEEKQRYLHEIVRVCESRDALHVAAPDLERFAEEVEGTVQAMWARSVLERIEDRPF